MPFHAQTHMHAAVCTEAELSELSSTTSWPRHGTLLWQVCWKCHHTYQGEQLSSHVGLCFLVFLWVNPTGMLWLPPMRSGWQCHPAVTAQGQQWDTSWQGVRPPEVHSLWPCPIPGSAAPCRPSPITWLIFGQQTPGFLLSPCPFSAVSLLWGRCNTVTCIPLPGIMPQLPAPPGFGQALQTPQAVVKAHSKGWVCWIWGQMNSQK